MTLMFESYNKEWAIYIILNINMIRFDDDNPCEKRLFNFLCEDEI